MSKLLTNTLFYTLASQISSASSLFALPLITPYLTELDYGVWGILMAYVGLTQAFVFLGLYITLTNSFYKHPHHYSWIWRQIYGFLCLWMPVFGVLNALFIYFIVPFEAKDNAILIAVLLTLPLIVFGPVSKLGEIKYQLEQNAKPIAHRASLLGIVGVALNVITIRYLGMGYMGWVWSNSLVTVLMNASYWFPLVAKSGLSPIYYFKWKTIKTALRLGIPTIPHKYSTYLLNSSDRVVLDNLDVSRESIGGYNLANSFGGYFNQLALGLEKALSPRILEQLKAGKDASGEVLFSFKILLSLSFIYGIWAKEIFFILVRNDVLRQYYELSIVLVFSYTYRPFYTAFSAKVLFNEKTKYLWLLSLSVGVLNVVSNFIFVPIFGYEVVAYSTLVSFMLLGFAGDGIKYFGSSPIFSRRIVWYSCSAIIFFMVFSMVLVNQSLNLKIAITLVVMLLWAKIYYGKIKD